MTIPTPGAVGCALTILVGMSMAGIAHALWMPSALARRLAIPLDGGLCWRGRRIFGEHKTVRGFVAIVPAAALAFALIGAWRDLLPATWAAGVWELPPLRMLALGASLKLLNDLGIDAVAASVLDITDRACERLTAIGARIVSDRRPDHRGGQQRSGIVAFEWPGHDPLAVKRHAMRRNVVFGCRAGRLRISPHAYNNDEDLDRLVEALESYRG